MWDELEAFEIDLAVGGDQFVARYGQPSNLF